MAFSTVTDLLPDPNNIASAEYRAIYEILEEVDDLELAMAILTEFKAHAEWIEETLTA